MTVAPEIISAIARRIRVWMGGPDWEHGLMTLTNENFREFEHGNIADIIRDGLANKPEWDLEFSVPLLPPSVNHYKQARRGGGWFKASQAIAYTDAVCVFSRKQPVTGDFYEVELTFELPPAMHRLKSNDSDNFLKVALDSLATAGVISNDGAVLDLIVHKRLVSTEGRTLFRVNGRKGMPE